METFLYNVNEMKRQKIHTSNEVIEYYNKISVESTEQEIEEDECLDSDDVDYYIDLDEESLRREYKTYRVTELRDILKYYSIPKKKMKKTDIIRKIVSFELNQENAALVQLRYSEI